MKTNVHIYPSTLLNASRIDKCTEWLVAKGVFDRVFTFGLLGDGLPSVENVAPHRYYVRLRCRRGSNARWVLKAMNRLVWFVRVIVVGKRIRPVCVNAHSVSVLPCAVALKWLCGAKLVYDTHELETEVKTAVGLRKVFVKLVERMLMPFVDEIIVVSGSIADWYQRVYNIVHPTVVRNIPSSGSPEARTRYLRDHFSIPDDDIIALYLGGLIAGRGLEELLSVWDKAPSNWHLVVVGYGALKGSVEQRAIMLPRIHLHPAVPIADVVKVASSADVGLSLLTPCCLSHAYALPNKLFEYLLAGVPVITNGLPEIKHIIEKNQCGWIVSLDRLEDMFSITRKDILEKAAHAAQAAMRYDWENEAEALVEPYRRLGFEEKGQ